MCYDSPPLNFIRQHCHLFHHIRNHYKYSFIATTPNKLRGRIISRSRLADDCQKRWWFLWVPSERRLTQSRRSLSHLCSRWSIHPSICLSVDDDDGTLLPIWPSMVHTRVYCRAPNNQQVTLNYGQRCLIFEVFTLFLENDSSIFRCCLQPKVEEDDTHIATESHKCVLKIAIFSFWTKTARDSCRKDFFGRGCSSFLKCC